MVLAGGIGSRLSSVVSDVPKPLAPVNGKPFLGYLLNRWIKIGIDEIVILAHHKSEELLRFIECFMESNNQRAVISVIVEEELLGTGGAISNAINKLAINDYFMVTNADTWISGEGIKPLLTQKTPCLASVYMGDCSRYGTLTIVDNKIVEFKEKLGMKIGGYINAGSYLLHPKLFIGQNKSKYSLESDLLPELSKKGLLNNIELEGELIDIGIPSDYYKFIENAEKKYDYK